MPDLITLPDAATMRARLRAVNNSDHVARGLYPALLARAGESMYREGIDLMVSQAIFDYTENLPPVMASVMNMQAPQFAAALAGDGE